jgi:hypothetical protein
LSLGDLHLASAVDGDILHPLTDKVKHIFNLFSIFSNSLIFNGLHWLTGDKSPETIDNQHFTIMTNFFQIFA